MPAATGEKCPSSNAATATADRVFLANGLTIPIRI
jgi:hypothetical protein